MTPRLNYTEASPKGLASMRQLQSYVDQCGLERPLIELVKTRASQINGCAYCLDMHTKDARAAGETEQRLFTLSAWRETPFFSEKELVDLTLAIVAINGWNRLAIPFRTPVGGYRPSTDEENDDSWPA